jgi:hypothetical protein
MTFFQKLAEKFVVPAAKTVDLGIAVAVPYSQVVTTNAVALASTKAENGAKWLGEKSSSLFERASKQLAAAKERVALSQGATLEEEFGTE